MPASRRRAVRPGGPLFALRTWGPADAPALVRAWADPEIVRRLDPPRADVAGANEWLRGEPERRQRGVALDLVVDVGGDAVGEVGFSSFDTERRACLVGYWLAPGVRGARLATAALSAATAFVLDTVGVAAVLAECDPDNAASARTALGAGFRFLGRHEGLDVYVRNT